MILQRQLKSRGGAPLCRGHVDGAVGTGVGVGIDVTVGVADDVGTGVAVGVAVEVCTGVAVGDAAGVALGVGIGIAVGVGAVPVWIRNALLNVVVKVITFPSRSKTSSVGPFASD